jgi:transcriptional regulator with XRE-family HTH domain
MPRAAPGHKKRTIRTPEDAFGHVLRTIRQSRSVSQEALAFEGGYHRTYIGQIERGEKSPSLRTIFDLAKALKSSPSDMIRQAEVILNRR